MKRRMNGSLKVLHLTKEEGLEASLKLWKQLHNASKIETEWDIVISEGELIGAELEKYDIIIIESSALRVEIRKFLTIPVRNELEVVKNRIIFVTCSLKVREMGYKAVGNRRVLFSELTKQGKDKGKSNDQNHKRRE